MKALKEIYNRNKLTVVLDYSIGSCKKRKHFYGYCHADGKRERKRAVHY